MILSTYCENDVAFLKPKILLFKGEVIVLKVDRCFGRIPFFEVDNKKQSCGA